MSLSKYKHEKTKAVKLFINREETLGFLHDQVEMLSSKMGFFKVVNIYGFGGIGKTRLIEHFLSKNKTREDIQFIQFSLEIFRNDSPIDTLVMLRKRIDDQCFIFDYAILKYWVQTKAAVLDTEFLKVIKDSRLLDILDISGSFFGINVSGITKLINEHKKKLTSNLSPEIKKYVSEIDQLSETSVDKLYNRFPCYLGVDIDQLTRVKRKRFCFLIDSFIQEYSYSTDNDWLMEFIGSAGIGMFIITSREKVDWIDRNSEWSQHMEQILLEELSPIDSVKFLKNNIGHQQHSLIDSMVQSSKGVPLFLDLCVDVYNSKYHLGQTILETDFIFQSEQDLVINFLNHLSSNHQEALKILSVVGLFNSSVYRHLIKSLSLKCTILEYDSLCNKTLVDYLHSETELHKVHDVIRANVFAILSPTQTEVILNSYFDYFSYKGLYEHKNRQLISILRNGFEIIESQRSHPPHIKQIESIIDILLFLHDNGWWIEIRIVLNSIKIENQVLRNIITLAEGLCLRRTRSISSGIKKLTEIKTISKQLGKHRYTLESELAYMYSLSGEYDKAYISFKSLYDSLNHDFMNERFYKKTTIQYADILMLKGDFGGSIMILEEFQNQYQSDDVDLLESKRIIGHNYRLNLFLPQAKLKYRETYNRAQKSDLLKGKLLTNICETLCYFEPEETLQIFDEAIEINTRIDSQIEIGKLYCAKGIALLSLRNFNDSEKMLRKALRIHRSIGYISGELFVLIGLYMLRYAQTGEVDDIVRSQIYKTLKLTKVYTFLLLPIFIIEENCFRILECQKTFKWLDFDYTKQQYIDFFRIQLKLKL